VRFHCEPLQFGLGAGLLGPRLQRRRRTGRRRSADRHQRLLRIDGLPLNPVARARPRDFIETGITAVDLMNSLVRGQKLPIFSGGGLPHDRIAVEIAGTRSCAEKRGATSSSSSPGLAFLTPAQSISGRSLEASGALERSVLFLNLASDSSTQRLLTPRFALTAAEYLAFVEASTYWSFSPT